MLQNWTVPPNLCQTLSVIQTLGLTRNSDVWSGTKRHLHHRLPSSEPVSWHGYQQYHVGRFANNNIATVILTSTVTTWSWSSSSKLSCRGFSQRKEREIEVWTNIWLITTQVKLKSLGLGRHHHWIELKCDSCSMYKYIQICVTEWQWQM